MSRIKAGLELAVELKEEEQLEEIVAEPTEETVEEFQEESLEDTIAAMDESFEQALKAFSEGSDDLEALKAERKKIIKQMDDITADGGTVPFGDPLNSRLKKINAKIKQASNKVSEGIWSDFKRDFLGAPRAGTAGKYFKHLSQVYAGKRPELSDYFSIMAGETPPHIDDPEKFKHDIERNVPLMMVINKELENAKKSAQMNELKEPDYSDDDTEAYLKKLTPKKVKKDYEKTLPKGHKSLAKKYNLEEVSDELVDRYRQKKSDQLSNIVGKAKGDENARVFDKDDVNTIMKRMRGTDLDVARNRRKMKMREDEDDGNLYTYRVLCTLKDYGHTMVSKRGEDIMKTVRVTAGTSNEAINKAKRHYKLKGYEVMDAEVVGKLPVSGEQVNEGYEDRVKQVAQRLMPQLSAPITKEDLLAAIKRAAYDVPDMKIPNAAKDFIKDVYQAVKPRVKWHKKAAPAKPKINLQAVGNMVMDMVGKSFPDGDPLDFIVPKLQRAGINTDAGVEKLLDKALKSIGYKGGYYNTLADFWDEMKAQADYDAQHGHPSHLNLGDKNPWRIKEDSQLDEISMGKAIKAYGASGTSGDYMTDKEYNQQHRLRGHIKRKFGDKAADHADAHWQSQFTGRAYPQGEDPLTSRPKPKGLTKAGKLSKTDTGVMKRDIKSRLGMSEEAGETTNPKDKVTLDIPLLIRLLEYAREDAKTDMDLHDLTEKLIALGSEGGRTLSMKDYDQLVQHAEQQGTTDEPMNEAKNPAMKRAKLVAKMEKNAPSFKAAMAKKDKKDVKEDNRSNRLDDLYDREMRKLDKELEAGHITQAEYNKQARNLNRELEDEYDEGLNETYVIRMTGHDHRGELTAQVPNLTFKNKKEAKAHAEKLNAKRNSDQVKTMRYEVRKGKMGGKVADRAAAAKKFLKDKTPKK